MDDNRAGRSEWRAVLNSSLRVVRPVPAQDVRWSRVVAVDIVSGGICVGFGFTIETSGPDYVVTWHEQGPLSMLGTVEALERLGMTEERAVAILTVAMRTGQARGQW